MRQELMKTLEVLSQPVMLDAWWVSVNGETIPDPQTLEQAQAYKPPRSRATVLILHTSLSDEWIPIRDIENLVKRHAYDPEKAKRLEKDAEEEKQRIADELKLFKKELPSELEDLKGAKGLVLDPSPEQVAKILAKAEACAERGEYLDHEEIIKKACPECFDPASFESPDLYEEALGLVEMFDPLICGSILLYDSDRRSLGIEEVIKTPTPGQLVKALKSFKNGWNGGEDFGGEDCCGENRKLAKRVAKLFPELVKDTPEARQFFNPQPKGEIPSSKPKPFIQQSKKANGKKETTITIGPVTILVLVLVIAFLVSRCL